MSGFTYLISVRSWEDVAAAYGKYSIDSNAKTITIRFKIKKSTTAP